MAPCLLNLKLGLEGVESVGPLEKSNPVNLDSRSLSPRISCIPTDEPNKRRYQDLNGNPVERFLLDKYDFDAECRVFDRAIKYLAPMPSAEEVCASPLPSRKSLSNVALVDIIDMKGKEAGESYPFHTVCLWKMQPEFFLVIDPNNNEYTERLESGLKGRFDNLKIEVHRHNKGKFYQSLRQDGSHSSNAPVDGNIINKDDRECIDIAVKIAFVINSAQLFASSSLVVKSQIDYLSNQSDVNPLLQGGSHGAYYIGWLQNADIRERAETVRLLLENKEYLAFMKGIKDIESLRKLNELRLQFIKRSGYENPGEFAKLMEEIGVGSKDKVSIRLSVDDFSNHVINSWEGIDDLKKKCQELGKEAGQMRNQLKGVAKKNTKFKELRKKRRRKVSMTVQFDPYRFSHDVISVDEPVKLITSEELRLSIRKGNYQEALTFISSMDKNVIGEPDCHGQTALHWAALCDNEEIASALLEKIDEDTILAKTNENGQTALHFAARENSTKFVKLFTKHQLAPTLTNAVDKDYQTPFHYALSRRNIQICEMLHDYLDLRTSLFLPIDRKQKFTLLHVAVHIGMEGMVRLLTNAFTEGQGLVGVMDIYGQTPLHWASGKGFYDICAILCEKMTSEQIGIQMQGRRQTALHFAVQGNYENIVELLLRRVKSGDELLGAQDEHGQTALHWAIGGNCCNFNICKRLCEKMTTDQICLKMGPNDRKQTSLHFAVQGKRLDIVKLLLERDDVASQLLEIPDGYNQTALYWAEQLGCIEISEYLLSRKAETDLLKSCGIDSRDTLD